MNIQFEKYRLEPEDVRFNLYKKVVSENRKTKEKYDSEINLGYAMTFERCIDTIAKDKMAENESTADFSTWIAEYKKVVNQILSVLK